jgi:hypothetical protein
MENPNDGMVDREFDSTSQAVLAAMRVVWGRVEAAAMKNPQARLIGANSV